MAVCMNSLYPVAAVGKRLLTGQVKNQAQQRQLSPLWLGKVTGGTENEVDKLVSHLLTLFFFCDKIRQQLPCFCTQCEDVELLMVTSTSFMQKKKKKKKKLTIFSQASTNVCLPAESMMQSSWRGKARREGKGRGVIHGDLVKLHGFKLPIFFGNDINVLPTTMPYCLLNTDEKLTILNVWENFFHTE